jgi:hypothetical protein
MRKRGVIMAVLTTAALSTGCEPYAHPCPAIAQVTGVSVTVAADYAPAVGTLHLKACQDGGCTEADLDLRPGSASIDQGCTPDGVCSATASPDGTKVGTLMLDTITESPMAVTASGFSPDRTALPARAVEFRPRATYPFGEQCGKFIVAAVTLDSSGLRERD